MIENAIQSFILFVFNWFDRRVCAHKMAEPDIDEEDEFSINW
jgi:hypothetical protein